MQCSYYAHVAVQASCVAIEVYTGKVRTGLEVGFIFIFLSGKLNTELSPSIFSSSPLFVSFL